MLFLQIFIRVSIQFGGWVSEQQQGNSRKISLKILQVFAGKTSIFVNADTKK